MNGLSAVQMFAGIVVVIAALGLIFVIALVVGYAWRVARGQVVVALYIIDPDESLAELELDKRGVYAIQARRGCRECEEKREQEQLRQQLDDPEEQL